MTAEAPRRTLGIDLAARPPGTAACSIDWRSEGATVEWHRNRLEDGDLVELLCDRKYVKVAIDCPFGWPVEFARAVQGWSEHQQWPIPLHDPDEAQEAMLLRQTDRVVVQITGEPFDPGAGDASRRGKRPLSVSTNLLGVTAMRCARLLQEVGRREGEPVNRAGGGRIVEVYPDAALREWDLWDPEWDKKGVGYKGSDHAKRERRGQLLDHLESQVDPWLEISPAQRAKCLDSDDDFDALICALVARAAQVGATRPIPPSCDTFASIEGWIHLPNPRSLAELAP